MKESEQAQAIDPIAYAYEVLRRKLRYEAEHKDTPQAIDDLIEMVVTQAQKIADLNRVGSNTLLALIEAQEKIAKQAKEIERLKQ